VKRIAGFHTPGVSEFVMASVIGYLMLIRRLGLGVGWGCCDKQVGGREGAFLPHEHYSYGCLTTPVQLLQVKWYVAKTFCRCGSVQQVLYCHIAKLLLVLGTEACLRACLYVKGALCTERGVTDANTCPNPDTQFLVKQLCSY
jgi:hypothetical protein